MNGNDKASPFPHDLWMRIFWVGLLTAGCASAPKPYIALKGEVAAPPGAVLEYGNAPPGGLQAQRNKTLELARKYCGGEVRVVKEEAPDRGYVATTTQGPFRTSTTRLERASCACIELTFVCKDPYATVRPLAAVKD